MRRRNICCYSLLVVFLFVTAFNIFMMRSIHQALPSNVSLPCFILYYRMYVTLYYLMLPYITLCCRMQLICQALPGLYSALPFCFLHHKPLLSVVNFLLLVPLSKICPCGPRCDVFKLLMGYVKFCQGIELESTFTLIQERKQLYLFSKHPEIFVFHQVLKKRPISFSSLPSDSTGKYKIWGLFKENEGGNRDEGYLATEVIDITLITQTSVWNLPDLVEMSDHWSGKISVGEKT